MNVNQQLALGLLWKEVEEVEPGKHEIATRKSLSTVTIMCRCGWSRTETRRQNALARAAKLTRVEMQHLRDVLQKHGRIRVPRG